MIAHIALALVAACCAYMVLAALSVPGADPRHDARDDAAALVWIFTFVLVLAAERGWYS